MLHILATSVSDLMEVELERASNIPGNGVDVHLFALFPLVFDNCESNIL